MHHTLGDLLRSAEGLERGQKSGIFKEIQVGQLEAFFNGISSDINITIDGQHLLASSGIDISRVERAFKMHNSKAVRKQTKTNQSQLETNKYSTAVQRYQSMIYDGYQYSWDCFVTQTIHSIPNLKSTNYFQIKNIASEQEILRDYISNNKLFEFDSKRPNDSDKKLDSKAIVRSLFVGPLESCSKQESLVSEFYNALLSIFNINGDIIDFTSWRDDDTKALQIYRKLICGSIKYLQNKFKKEHASDLTNVTPDTISALAQKLYDDGGIYAQIWIIIRAGLSKEILDKVVKREIEATNNSKYSDLHTAFYLVEDAEPLKDPSQSDSSQIPQSLSDDQDSITKLVHDYYFRDPHICEDNSEIFQEYPENIFLKLLAQLFIWIKPSEENELNDFATFDYKLDFLEEAQSSLLQNLIDQGMLAKDPFNVAYQLCLMLDFQKAVCFLENTKVHPIASTHIIIFLSYYGFFPNSFTLYSQFLHMFPEKYKQTAFEYLIAMHSDKMFLDDLNAKQIIKEQKQRANDNDTSNEEEIDFTDAIDRFEKYKQLFREFAADLDSNNPNINLNKEIAIPESTDAPDKAIGKYLDSCISLKPNDKFLIEKRRQFREKGIVNDLTMKLNSNKQKIKNLYELFSTYLNPEDEQFSLFDSAFEAFHFSVATKLFDQSESILPFVIEDIDSLSTGEYTILMTDCMVLTKMQNERPPHVAKLELTEKTIQLILDVAIHAISIIEQFNIPEKMKIMSNVNGIYDELEKKRRVLVQGQKSSLEKFLAVNKSYQILKEMKLIGQLFIGLDDLSDVKGLLKFAEKTIIPFKQFAIPQWINEPIIKSSSLIGTVAARLLQLYIQNTEEPDTNVIQNVLLLCNEVRLNQETNNILFQIRQEFHNF